MLVEGTTRGAYTKPDGTYRILKVPIGVYQLRVKQLGFEDAVSTINVPRQDTVTVDFLLPYHTREILYPDWCCGLDMGLTNLHLIGTMRVISTKELEHTPP